MPFVVIRVWHFIWEQVTISSYLFILHTEQAVGRGFHGDLTLAKCPLVYCILSYIVWYHHRWPIFVVAHSRLGLPAQWLARHNHKNQLWGVGAHLLGFDHPSSFKRRLCFESANDSKILQELMDFVHFTQVPLLLPRYTFKISFYAPTWKLPHV